MAQIQPLSLRRPERLHALVLNVADGEFVVMGCLILVGSVHGTKSQSFVTIHLGSEETLHPWGIFSVPDVQNFIDTYSDLSRQYQGL